MKIKKNKLVITVFLSIVVMVFLVSKQLLTPNADVVNNKPLSKNEKQNDENNFSGKTGQESKSTKENICSLNQTKKSKNYDKDLKLLEKLETAQDFDEYTEQFDDYFYIDEQTIKQMILEIQTKNENIVTNTQLAKLRNDLKKSILAYKQGDVNAIMEEILKAPCKINPEATAWHLNTLQTQYLKTPEERLSNDSNKIMKLLISRNYGGENGSGYKDICNELSVTGSGIEFYSTQKIPESIHDKLFRLMDFKAYTFKNGYVTLTPSVEYLSNPAKILKEQSKLLYADIRIAASNDQNAKYSRLKRYYWSKNDDCWLPMEFVILPPSGSRFEFF